MWKKIYKKIKKKKKNYKKQNLLEDLKKSLLSFSFIMIYKIHKKVVLIKNHLNYSKYYILECFFKKYNRLLFFKKIISFFIMYNNGKFMS